jgi:HSP20 family protein
MVKRIKPVSRIVKLEAEINRIIGEAFLKDTTFTGLDESFVPLVDISEKADEIIVKVELPGVSQKDVTILLHSSRVEIKGIKRERRTSSKIKYLRLERLFGTFRRYIYLPAVVMTDNVSAILENGVLTIVLKKYKRRKAEEVIVKIEKSKA